MREDVEVCENVDEVQNRSVAWPCYSVSVAWPCYSVSVA